MGYSSSARLVLVMLPLGAEIRCPNWSWYRAPLHPVGTAQSGSDERKLQRRISASHRVCTAIVSQRAGLQLQSPASGCVCAVSPISRQLLRHQDCATRLAPSLLLHTLSCFRRQLCCPPCCLSRPTPHSCRCYAIPVVHAASLLQSALDVQPMLLFDIRRLAAVQFWRVLS